MSRKILLIEPNYNNKFPPVALMKLSTYYKNRGDEVRFYKGEIKEFIIERIVEKCIDSFNEIDSSIVWKSRHSSIHGYIKTRKLSYYEELHLEESSQEIVLSNWLNYYKDYYWKKTYLKEPEWDKICITTLFTFYFDITVKTINEVKVLAKPGDNNVMVGGVLATLQPDEIEAATGIKPHQGLLITPGELDEGDTQIIDTLPLDYTILDEIEYRYEMSNAYYAYLTRGCIRNCSFCAVSKLEPVYQEYIPLKERIQQVEDVCGKQQDLLLMDNNVLASCQFDTIIEEIISCGFERGATYEEPDHLTLSIENLRRGLNDRAFIRKSQGLMLEYYNSIKEQEQSYEVYKILDDNHLLKYETTTKDALLAAYDAIKDDYKKSYNKKKRLHQRFVDFNQGVDARLFTPHIAEQFARIAISPLRIAFDSIAYKEPYLKAIKMCADNGLKQFSNYLLFNFHDKPDELYERIRINVELCEELNVNIYSFPMKFHPLYGDHSHDRNFIGENWNMKYIRATQAILNSTHGMVGRGITFFYKAFGADVREFMTLLEMPDAMIVYRFFFEWLDTKNHPLSMGNWINSLNSLNEEEREQFFGITHSSDFSNGDKRDSISPRIDKALSFYINLRNAVAKPEGSLYKLKQEFDKLPKEELIHIKKNENHRILKIYMDL